MSEVTQCDQVFTCIQPAEPVSAETVMKRTGLSRHLSSRYLSHLLAAGKLVKLARGVYALVGSTPPLELFAKEVLTEDQARRKARRAASQARYMAKVRKAREGSATPQARTLREIDPIRVAPKDMVSKAIAARSDLAMAWGGSYGSA